MTIKKLSCKTKLKKCIIKKDVFDREIALCKKLFNENKGKCEWGKCRDCGTLFLLYKLHKGKLIESKDEIEKIRMDILGV